MGERKPIPKSVRFEVFKRDMFTCQYCGRKAPEVVLEIDHIIPVAEGGTNDFVNLVTSCMDCNRGKGKKKLNDDSALIKQRKEMERMAERQEQAKMLALWKQSLVEADNELIEYLHDRWISMTGYELSDSGLRNLHAYYRRFGFELVDEAMEIAVYKYFRDSKFTAQKAFDKVGGICYNKKFKGHGNAKQNN